MWYTRLYVLERHLGSISEVYLSSVERQPLSSSEVGAASRPLRPGFDLGTPGARGRASPTHSLLRGKSPLGLGDPPWAASSASDAPQLLKIFALKMRLAGEFSSAGEFLWVYGFSGNFGAVLMHF